VALEPTAGTVFGGRYQLIRRLASGAMGVVYEAQHIATDRRCALKVMLAHIVPRPELRKRFELEAWVTAHIDSPFLVEVFDAGVDDATGMPFLVMELLRGEELGQCLRRVGRFSAEETLACLHQAALALDRTHGASIVHRDLKPANLFLSVGEDGERRIKILDFGVAKIVAESTGGTTTSMGTPLYMAPEQFRGQRVSAATDIHALGMMAYTLLVGEAYWADEKQANDDLVAFALSAAYGPVEPACARAMRKGVVLPAGFDAWFARATAVDPSQRFPAATAAVRALGDALGIADLTALALPRPDLGLAEESLSGEATAPERRHPTGDGETRSDPGAIGRADTAPARSESSGTRRDEARSSGTEAGKRRAGKTRAAETRPARMAPRRRRARSIFLLAVTGGLVVAAFGVWRIERPQPPPIVPPAAPRAVSPLQPSSSVLACPPLEASGVEEPVGWLGAAAATVVCERARLILGGASGRTLVPAELLGLPPDPVGRFPIDPYGQADARVRLLKSARRRAAAYVDGEVVKEASGFFRVSLVLRRPDGGEFGRGWGAGRGLPEAAREAMNPIVGAAGIPRAAALDPAVADFSRARDIDGALVLLDLALAMINNAGGLPDECKRFEANAADLAELGPVELRHCDYTLGRPLRDVVLPPGGAASPGGLAARARADHVIRRVDDPAAIEELDRLFKRELTAVGRSTLATSLSCLLESPDPERARYLALRAVEAEPRNAFGEGCAPWLQLLAVTQSTASTQVVLRALQAWAPWNSYGWLYQARNRAGQGDALVYARRAYVLSPFDTSVAGTFAGQLLASGAREEARSIAGTLANSDYPVHRVSGESLLVRIAASEARFGAALSQAKTSMAVFANEVGWLRAQRFEIAWYALQIALILGRTQEIADLVVERFLDPEPPPLDGAHIDVALRLPAVCAHASPAVSHRCFVRFRDLRQRLSYSLLPDTDAFIAGAERYANRDFAGAARAFRPLLRTSGPFVEVLAEPMVETFEHTGESDLVDRVEAAIVDHAAELNGASLALVRAARRAAKRGDAGRARALAEKVIQAWSVADEPVPAVAEMRRLVQALGAPAP
jgi:serine/threonine protein kinase